MVSDPIDVIAKILMTLLDKDVQDAAWYYPEPYEKALNIKDHVAFCEFQSFPFPFSYTATDSYRLDKTKVQVTVE